MFLQQGVVEKIIEDIITPEKETSIVETKQKPRLSEQVQLEKTPSFLDG
jgi:hypothetical protein